MNRQPKFIQTIAICGLLAATLSVSLNVGLTQTVAHASPNAKPLAAITATPAKKAVELLPQPKSGFPQGIAPERARVDLIKPTFTNPGTITNALLPFTQVDQIVQVGQKDGLPHRTELTLLPTGKTSNWLGHETNVRALQFVAYLDGRILETAVDYVAQADDGAVWYFGEDVNNYTDGKIANTAGTWQAGKDVPPAMIMPANPKIGNAYRIENIPGLVFEEATVKAINQTIEGPRGLLSGVMFVEQIGLDGKSTVKAFAPGYGEFLAHSEDAAVALPTDATKAPMPTELKILLTEAMNLMMAPDPKNWQTISTTLQTMTDAWDAYSASKTSEKLQLLNSQFERAFNNLIEGSKEFDIKNIHHAAFDVAVAVIDLQMPYRSVAESDLTRLTLWANRIQGDSLEGTASDVAGDFVVVELIVNRNAHHLDAAKVKELQALIATLRKAANGKDGVTQEALVKLIATLKMNTP